MVEEMKKVRTENWILVFVISILSHGSDRYIKYYFTVSTYCATSLNLSLPLEIICTESSRVLRC
jgi:hypothetical protein